MVESPTGRNRLLLKHEMCPPFRCGDNNAPAFNHTFGDAAHSELLKVMCFTKSRKWKKLITGRLLHGAMFCQFFDIFLQRFLRWNNARAIIIVIFNLNRINP